MLTITRGLPGSGKTTLARAQQAANPNLWRINRDDIRAMLRSSWEWGNDEHENACTLAQAAAIRALLNNGHDVIADDTNLNPDHLDALRRLAAYCDAEFVVHDMTDVPLHECIRRDNLRRNPVGTAVIHDMHKRWLASAEAKR